MLYDAVNQVIEDHGNRPNSPVLNREAIATNPWSVDVRFTLPDGQYRIRSLERGDERTLAAFGASLGDTAREMFCPYPWADADACAAAFRHAVEQSVTRVDASYLLERDGEPIGHFFLWKAGGNPVSRQVDLDVPELGVAIVDAFTGQGLGSLAVRFLVTVAAELDADAVELTTASENDAGWQTYQRAGFTYTGMLRIPLGVDVTAVESGEIGGTRFRIERQMVHILQPSKTAAILAYLAAKR